MRLLKTVKKEDYETRLVTTEVDYPIGSFDTRLELGLGLEMTLLYPHQNVTLGLRRIDISSARSFSAFGDLNKLRREAYKYFDQQIAKRENYEAFFDYFVQADAGQRFWDLFNTDKFLAEGRKSGIVYNIQFNRTDFDQVKEEFKRVVDWQRDVLRYASLLGGDSLRQLEKLNEARTKVTNYQGTDEFQTLLRKYSSFFDDTLKFTAEEEAKLLASVDQLARVVIQEFDDDK
jgi:hypothetical protein